MNTLIILFSLTCLMTGRFTENYPNHNNKIETPKELILTILYDNYNYDENFRSSWGFSCLIECEDWTILFDTGGDDGNLMDNFRAAGKDPGKVDLVVLSHYHWDHTGGLSEFLDYRTGIEVYLPASFPDSFKRDITSKGARPVEVKDAGMIARNVWTTGEMGDEIIEQSLAITTPGGLVILTGCAHPGIERIVEKTARERSENILLTIGGFHLLRTDTKTVESIAADFKEQGTDFIAPTHCSGEVTLDIFRKTFGNRFIQAGAGKVIRTSEL